MPYYVMDWRVEGGASERLAGIDVIPATEVPWTQGVSWAPGMSVPDPIEFVLDEKRGSEIPDVFLVGIPLVSPRMLEILRQTGVDNIDTYNAVIVDPRTGARYDTYRAVNIIGTVACADLKKSAYDPDFKPPWMVFRRLVIDETRTNGLGFFRLAEAPKVIIASEDVARALRTVRLTGFRLLPAT